MTAQAAFAPLSPDEIDGALAPTQSLTKTPIVPVPEDAPSCNFRHPVYGEPAGKWPWYDANGKLNGYTMRFEFDENGERKKEFLPIAFCEVIDGRRTYRAWRSCGFPAPRSLYRLPDLLASPETPVIVTEGEKKAERAVQLFPDYVSTTTMSGAKSPHLSDFGPLAGRRVVIWPDHDEPGVQYAREVAKLAVAAGASSVSIVHVRDHFPHKWDLADDLPQGISMDQLHELLASAVAYEVNDDEAMELPPGYRLRSDGLYWVERGSDEENGERKSSELLLCGPLEIVAETRDADGCSWGLRLRWEDHDGRVHEVTLERSILAGDGTEARRLFLDGGLYVACGRKARERLNDFLLSVRAPRRSRATNHTGWHGNQFVLPDRSFGGEDKEQVVLQGRSALEHDFKISGTLEDWNTEIARYARGNSRLVVAIATAFAPPLLNLGSLESGGIHLRGASSTGKSTALMVAGSVWGGGQPGGFVNSWRATANGLEGVASAHCDTLVCLDEMSQLPSRDAGEVAYMLANGSGKSRANRDGGARRASRWRLLFLSSGEIGLEEKVAENGQRRAATAGQQVRVVDLTADAGAGLGIFENLHDFGSADALARHLRSAALANYGTPIRAFLETLTNDHPDEAGKAINDMIEKFVKKHVPEGADGQVLRVAQRFGLIAAAGELAIVFKVITEWTAGDVIEAAARCFLDWMTARGGVEPAEVSGGIAQVRAFLSANGEARFIRWDQAEGDASRIPVREVAGFRKRNDGGGYDYFVTTSAWKDEVSRGFDHKALANALIQRGLMEGAEEDRLAKSIRVPGVGRRRLYHVSARLLTEEEQ